MAWCLRSHFCNTLSRLSSDAQPTGIRNVKETLKPLEKPTPLDDGSDVGASPSHGAGSVADRLDHFRCRRASAPGRQHLGGPRGDSPLVSRHALSWRGGTLHLDLPKGPSRGAPRTETPSNDERRAPGLDPQARTGRGGNPSDRGSGSESTEVPEPQPDARRTRPRLQQSAGSDHRLYRHLERASEC